MIKQWLLLLTLCTGLVSVKAPAEAASETKTESGQRVVISRAWSPVAPPGSSAHAGYFTISNRYVEPLTIVAISSPRYGRVEIHRSRIEDGVATMIALDSVAIPAHRTTQFAPGGMHLMMSAPSPRQKEEDIPVRLHFKNGETLSFTLSIGAVPSEESTPQAEDHSAHHVQQSGELHHAH